MGMTLFIFLIVGLPLAAAYIRLFTDDPIEKVEKPKNRMDTWFQDDHR